MVFGRKVLFLLSCAVCSCVALASSLDQFQQRLRQFSALSGNQQVAIVFDEYFHKRSLVFWRRSPWYSRSESDGLLRGEQDILISSPDTTINRALASEAKALEIKRARYAVFLLGMRARFVPQSKFLIAQVNGTGWSPDGTHGSISPFPPDLDLLGPEARQALRKAIDSPNPRLNDTARVYTLSILEELSHFPTLELAKRWRAVTLSDRYCGQCTSFDSCEQVQFASILKQALAERGIGAVTALAWLLKIEQDPEARYQEIYMLQFLDIASVRLRGSTEGREAILVARGAWTKKLRICGRIEKNPLALQNSWDLLEDQFLRDKIDSGVGSWATLTAVALDQRYGDRLSVPFDRGYRKCGPQMLQFLSRLTDIDPTFPSWEFTSTGGTADVMHPRFLAKIARYQDALVNAQLVQ